MPAVFGDEEREIEIFKKTYDMCLGLLCPVCMSECRALAYFSMNLVKLRAGMIKEEDLLNDELFGEATAYLKAFFDAKKDLIEKIVSKVKAEEVKAKEGDFAETKRDGEFVEEKS